MELLVRSFMSACRAPHARRPIFGSLSESKEAPLCRRQERSNINPTQQCIEKNKLVRRPLQGYVDRMTIRHLLLLTVALIGSQTASAQKTKQIPLPASQNPSNSNLPISA